MLWRLRSLWTLRIVGRTAAAAAATDRSHVRALSPGPRRDSCNRSRGCRCTHVPILRSRSHRRPHRSSKCGASAGHQRALRARVIRRYRRVVSSLRRMRGPGCSTRVRRRRGGRRRCGPGCVTVRVYMRSVLSNFFFISFPFLRFEDNRNCDLHGESGTASA
jgi:hypothetical protein